MNIYIKNKILHLFVVLTLVLFSTSVGAQSPGGTTLEKELWLKSDMINPLQALPADGAPVSAWVDLSGKTGRSFGAAPSTTAKVPNVKYNGLNYSPAVNFYATNCALLSGSTPITAPIDKSYYTFWVSKINPNLSPTGPIGVLSYHIGGSPYTYVGWNKPSATNFQARTVSNSDVINFGTAHSTYGIGASISPNDGKAMNELYFNGLKSSTAGNTGLTTLPTRTEFHRAALGALTTTVTSYAFVGDMQEIIVLSAPKGQVMSATDLNKVYSYLAIKYGLTLDRQQMPNYVASDGTVIWDGSIAGYQNNIFGIGFDKTSGLNQKQSTSVDNDVITVFIGNSLADLNIKNTGVFANDKTFVMLGSNGKAKNQVNLYTHPAGTAYAGGTSIDTEVNNSYGLVFKAKVTGSTSQTVSIKAKLDADYVLVSKSDDTFSPANTRAYKVDPKTGVATGVVIEDGDLVGFAVYKGSPGGVVQKSAIGANKLFTELWLSSDRLYGSDKATPLPADKEDVANWNDYSTNLVEFVQNNNATADYNGLPRVNYDGFNYQPAIEFYVADTTDAASATLLDLHRKLVSTNNFPLSNTKSYYSFHVSEVFNEAGTATVINYGNAVSDNDGWNASTPGVWMENSSGAMSHPTNAGKTYGIGASIRPNSTATTAPYRTLYQDGIPFANNSKGAMSTTAGQLKLGNSNLAADNPFVGKMYEIILMSAPGNAAIDGKDLQRINSYLAIKYGITLDRTAQPDYTLSDDQTVVWSKYPGYEDYQKDIFGIGRDDVSELYKKQATSADRKTMTVFVGDDLADLDMNNTTGTIDNMHFLMFGSNGQKGFDKIDWPAGTVIGGITTARNLNALHAVRFKAKTTNQASFTIKIMSHVETDYILVSNDPAFPLTSATRAYPVNDVNIANNVVINDGDYVGFVTYRVTPGGAVGLETAIWLAADNLQGAKGKLPENGASVNSWKDMSLNGMNFVQNGKQLVPSIDYNGTNFHPTIDFATTGNTTTGTAAEKRTKLISEDVFPMTNSKAYYTFWVSNIDTENSSTFASMFSYGSRGDVPALRNYVGWYQRSGISYPLHTVQGDTITKRTNLGTFGIGAAIIPNDGTVHRQFFNGIQNLSNNRSQKKMPNTTGVYTPTNAILGNYTLTNGNHFFGDVQEVIVLSTDKLGYISDSDLHRVYSYLAVKYGTTLDKNTIPEYLDSKGNSIWKFNQNVGYDQHVFGIGRDDETNLYQKQARSVDNPNIAISIGAEFANLNKNNTGILQNSEFLMFGSNGKIDVDFEEYKYEEGAQFDGATIKHKINYRYANILKAQLTGRSTYTISVMAGGLYVLVSDDPSFIPSKTRIYPIEKGVAKDVVIKEGEYMSVAIFGKAPGGVFPGLRMWMNTANVPTVESDADGVVKTWEDMSGYGTIYKYRKAERTNLPPSYIKSHKQLNFYPAINFKRQYEYLSSISGPMRSARPDAFTVIGVVNSDFTLNENNYFFGFGGPNGRTVSSRKPALGVSRRLSSGLYIGRGRYYENSTGERLSSSTVKLFNPGATTIASYSVFKKNRIDYEFDAGVAQTVANASIGNSTSMNTGGTLGSASYQLRTMFGVMGEAIAYEKALTQGDKNKINSYLGLKYAITLDLNKASATTNFDYFLSDSTIVWPGTSDPINAKYHHNVAGLVKDDDADLHNKQARSTDVGWLVHMGIGKSLGTEGDLTGFAEDLDKCAIVWGHDGAPEVYKDLISYELCAPVQYRTSKVWLAEKTGIKEQDVILRVGSADDDKSPDTSFRNGSGYQYYLLVADNEQDFVNEKWKIAIPGRFVDGYHQFGYTFRNQKTYFSFAYRELPGNCPTCEFKGPKTLEYINKTTWNNGETSRNFSLGDDFVPNVTATNQDDPIAKFRRGYPRADRRTKSLMMYRTGDATKDLTTTISLNNSIGNAHAAATSFEIFDIDYAGSRRYDKVEVIGECTGGIVYPKLSFMIAPSKTLSAAQRSAYTIDGNVANSKRRGFSYPRNEGRMLVEFQNPVEKVIVKYKTAGRPGRATLLLGVGPMQFSCPQPLPPVNEDGLVMTKEASKHELLLCEEVIYTFRITNTTCIGRSVNFEDVLPAGMKWASNSLMIDNSAAMGENTLIDENYGKSRNLKIDSLRVPPSTELVLRAKATFDFGAQPKMYSNRANISYTKLVESVPTRMDLTSCDRFSPGCEPTTINALYSERPLMIETKQEKLSKSCYKEDDEITFSLTIKNRNEFTSKDVMLTSTFNEEFAYILNSVQSSLDLTSATITWDPIEEPGLFSIEGLDIPAGESTISFKIKAPKKENLIQEEDDNGQLIPDQYVPLTFDYELSSNSDDPCEGSIFSDIYGAYDVPYCLSKDYIISNKPATNVIKKNK